MCNCLDNILVGRYTTKAILIKSITYKEVVTKENKWYLIWLFVVLVTIF